MVALRIKLVLLSIIVCIHSTFAANFEDKNLLVSSDHFLTDNNQTIFYGNAVINFGLYKLFTQKIEIYFDDQRKIKKIIIPNHFILIRNKSDILIGEQAVYQSKTIIVDKRVKGFISGNFVSLNKLSLILQ